MECLSGGGVVDDGSFFQGVVDGVEIVFDGLDV